MFVAEALFNFSRVTMCPQEDKEEEPLYSKQAKDEEKKEKEEGKRQRSKSLDKQLKQDGEDKDEQENKQGEKKDTDEIVYLTFEKGEKILVEQAFENGWWYGNAIKRPNDKGFFPSNYVQVGAKPPPPAPPKAQQKEEPQQQQQQEGESYEQQQEEEEQNEVKGKPYDPNDTGSWLNQQLSQLGEEEKGAITSDYYHGIKGFKYVKINDNNKNILNGNYVKFDVATGLARVPIKDQAPCSKAVRQMGYYFDYHQWNEERNRNPEAHRNRPDPKKKRKKRLHLVGMGKEG